MQPPAQRPLPDLEQIRPETADARGQPATGPRWLSRRSFISLTATALGAALLTGCRNEPDSAQSDISPRGTAFAEPTVIASNGGHLETTLLVASESVEWRDGTRWAYTYNGSTPGPTLHVRPGDRLTIHLKNDLDEPTNLHTHGLHVSPEGNADNIFLQVAPGESHTYVYDIPQNHRSGLFWYHPHLHGTVARQVAAGLAGAIVVADDIDDRPELAESTERIWILSDPPIGSGPQILDVTPMEQMAGRQGDAILVNGIDRPDIEAESGDLERWRLVNASASRYYRIALDNHELVLIGSDGGRLAHPRVVDELLLAPGERAEILVTPSNDGSYQLRDLRYDRDQTGMGTMMSGGNTNASGATIATLTVTGRRQAATTPRNLATEPPSLNADSTRQVVLGMGMDMGRGMANGEMMSREGQMVSFTIDGNTFASDRVDIATSVGTVEEWEIRNATPMDHPLHLHVWPFLISDDSQAGWKDTVNIPAGQTVRILVPFEGISGKTVYHCHILDHEDLGMMGVIEAS